MMMLVMMLVNWMLSVSWMGCEMQHSVDERCFYG